MKSKAKLEIDPKVYLVPMLFVLTIWLVFWIEVNFKVNFIKPETRRPSYEYVS